MSNNNILTRRSTNYTDIYHRFNNINSISLEYVRKIALVLVLNSNIWTIDYWMQEWWERRACHFCTVEKYAAGVIVVVECRGRVFGMVHVAQDCGGAVCSLVEPATGLRFSEPYCGRTASRVTSPTKLKYPRCPAFHCLHTALRRRRLPAPHRYNI